MLVADRAAVAYSIATVAAAWAVVTAALLTKGAFKMRALCAEMMVRIILLTARYETSIDGDPGLRKFTARESDIMTVITMAVSKADFPLLLYSQNIGW